MRARGKCIRTEKWGASAGGEIGQQSPASRKSPDPLRARGPGPGSLVRLLPPHVRLGIQCHVSSPPSHVCEAGCRRVAVSG